MKAPYAVFAGLALLPSVVASQATVDWRQHFAAGEQARQAGDAAEYASEMAAAVRGMPEGLLNRPFAQYHAARAAAMAGRPTEAIAWLRAAWDEDIEALMISFAPYDPAFRDLLAEPAFVEVMGLASKLRLTVRPLGGSVYLLQGTGANVVAQVGEDGVFLVDTGYAPALPALRTALASLDADGVDLLLVTHAHEDHMGSTPELGADAIVVAHPRTAALMAEPYEFMEGVSIPAKPVAARPDAEIASDTTFRFNGEDVRISPTAAHTPGDLSVYFTTSHVAHLGDTYLPGNPMMYPGTEDPDAFLDRLESFIDSMHPATVVVGGHEAPADVAALRHQIGHSRACMAFVRASLADGMTIDETADAGADRFAPQWVAFFYRLFESGAG